MDSSDTVASAKYPYPVEVNVRDFVPINLSNGNYSVWKMLMLRLIKSQGLFGFINDEVSAPREKITAPDDDYSSTKEMENQDYQDYWKRSDALLQRWITGTTSEDVLPHLVGLKTAKDMWSNLITLYERKIEHPTEINVRDFVPIKLSKDNYFKWKTLMLGLIESQGLLGFINGEVSAPPERIEVPGDDGDIIMKEIENQDYQDWKRLDKLLQKWIIETINEDVLPHVKCLKTAKDMWSKLIILREGKMEYAYRPVDINVTDFVPIKLSSDNYSSWKSLMLRFIERQGLLGFINGEVTKPAVFEDNNSNNDEWRKSDELLQIWIKKTINEDIVGELVLLETSKDIWERLNIILNETNIVYPYPIEVNVGDFVPFKLSGSSNYLMWRKLMLHLFEKQGLLGFILPQHQHNNMIIIPPYDSLAAWKRTDSLLQSWIIRTINENFLTYVVYAKTASEMWAKLETAITSEDSSTQTVIEYPYPVEVNVGNFVPVKLSRENYTVWKKLMHRLIQKQGLVDFINDKVRAPPERISWGENPNYKAWKRTDNLLQSWIMGTFNQKEVVACVDLKTAHEMWTKLEKIFTLKSSYKRSKSVRDRGDAGKDVGFYRPLHRATLRGEWDKAKQFLEQHQDAVSADITGDGDTVLMVAVSSERRNHFVKNLLEFMSSSHHDLAVTNNGYWTSLHKAAAAGNLEAAKLLVAKDQRLPNISDDEDYLPLHFAAFYGHRKMFLYLLDITREDIESTPFQGESGAKLVLTLILRGLYDITLLLVKRYPALVIAQVDGLTLLEVIAMEDSAFPSATKFNFWQSLIYAYVPARMEESTYHSSGGHIENHTDYCFYGTAKQKCFLLGRTLKQKLMIVPWFKHIRETKWKHDQALQLVRQLCMEYEKLDFSEIKDLIIRSLITAAIFGISEVVKEIISVFPEGIYITNEEEQNLIHIAILNRHKNVLKLLCQLTDKPIMHYLFSSFDSSGNTCHDMVACLKNEQIEKLKADAAGAALQMQLELQWFKEVKENTFFYGSKWKIGRKTPEMIFSETHKELMKEGEKWLKDTANSCTIVAALVVTIVFAAAITVPGGNDSNSGHPILSKDIAFIIFIIADALALFSSASSLLMFLSILTSRYAEIDFLYTLPKRLIIGLIAIFISIVFMMVAFGATLYLVFEPKKIWILAPMTAFAIVPVTLFASWQFPLLWDMIKSTYGEGILG